MQDHEIGRPPFVVFLDSQLRRIRQDLNDRERRICSAVSLGDSERLPAQHVCHLQIESPAPRHVVKPRCPGPSPVIDAMPPLRAKQLRRCACGCGLFALIAPGQDPRAAVFIEGHTQTPNRLRRRRIGVLTAAARAARQERSA